MRARRLSALLVVIVLTPFLAAPALAAEKAKSSESRSKHADQTSAIDLNSIPVVQHSR